MIPRSTSTLVVGDRVISVEIESIDDRTIDVVVRDRGRTWNFHEPAWRPLAFGAAGESAYWWSARRLVTLPEREHEDVETFELDEDILLVFRVPQGWLIVCETSARLRTPAGETVRLQFPDVVTDARWEDGSMVVEIWERGPIRVVVEEGSLRVQAGPLT